MRFTNEIYTRETLLGMLNLAIECMSENSICCHCPVVSDKTEKVCFDSDLCKASIFEGLWKNVQSKE